MNAVRFCASAALLLSAGALAQDATRWVQGMRVNLRDKPSPAAASIAQMQINTRLRLMKQDDRWCEVQRETPAQKGFVACELLAAQPVSLESIETGLKDARLTPARETELRLRAFWVSPSFARWAAFGYALGLGEADRHRGKAPAAPAARARNTDFDAMKALLASGTVVVQQPLPRMEQPVAAASAPHAQLPSALRRVPLPAAAASFFGESDLSAMVPTSVRAGPLVDEAGKPAWGWTDEDDPFTVLDALSHRARAKIKVTPVAAGKGETKAGVWDVEALRVDYLDPVRIEAVAASGRVAPLAVNSLRFTMGSGGCTPNQVLVSAPALPGGVKGMGDFLLAWIGKPAPGGSARIESRDAEAKAGAERLQVHAIDIDADSRPDFVVYEGTPSAAGSGPWRRVYANVAGRWRLVHSWQAPDCARQTASR